MPIEPASAGAILFALLLVALPGLALLELLLPGKAGEDPALRLGLALALGLALQPLIYLWAGVLGLRLGPALWWLLILASAAFLLLRRRRRPAPPDPAPGRAEPGWRRPGAAMVTLGGILLLALALRWWNARDLVVPMWGDSVHHSMIVRLFTLHGGLVESWEPFAPLTSFSYHFGLHAAVASLALLSGLPEPRALITGGQLLMVAQILTAYALAAGLTGRPWAGLGAALAAAGLSTMPAYYLNWGRYTQLAGQVLLPAAALATAWVAGGRRAWAGRGVMGGTGSDLEDGRTGQARGTAPTPEDASGIALGGLRSGAPEAMAEGGRGWVPGGWGPGVLAAILIAGLALTHYIVTLLFALFAVAWWLVAGGGWRGPGLRERGRALGRLVGLALAALVLALPWIPRFAAGPLGGTAIALSTRRVADPNVYGLVAPAAVWAPEPLGRLVGWPLVIALLASLAWGIGRRDRVVALGAAWLGLILLATYPGLLGLPVTGPLKDFTVAIGLYLPAGLVIGAALGDFLAWGLERRAPGPARRRLEGVAGALLLALALGLAWRGRAVIDAAHALVTPADLAALAWIRAETPPEALFLVGSFPAFGDTVLAGDDAGWWIPLLAEPRRSTLPPITYSLERSREPGYRERVNALAALWRADLDAPATRAALREAGVTHAFVGAKGTQLDRARLAASPHWERLYAADGAEVYRFRDAGDA